MSGTAAEHKHLGTGRGVARYLAVTFGLTYTAWGLRAALAALGVCGVGHIVSVALFYLGGFAPLIAALLGREDKSGGGVRRFLLDGNKRGVGILLAFCALFLLFCFASTGAYNRALPVALLPLVWLQCVLIAGGNEEYGWRGVLQPALETRLPFPVATLCTALVWALWHLPFWFTPGDTHVGTSFWMFALLGAVISFLLAALHKATGSSLYCAILHGTVNFALSAFAVRIDFAQGVAFYLGLAALVAISLWVWYRANARMAAPPA